MEQDSRISISPFFLNLATYERIIEKSSEASISNEMNGHTKHHFHFRR